jgi:glycosyltransferase involved in cell wall biosynthesis
VRVGLDVSPLHQTRAGTARYVHALLTHAPVDYAPFAWGGGGRAAAAIRDTVWYPLLLPMLATKSDVTALHCPTFRGPARSRVPMVVTVHDLAVLRHPETFNRWTRTYSRVAVPRVAGAASRLIAVSAFTKTEMVDLLGVAQDRVRVVPNGIEAAFAREGPAETGEYVLAVGTLEPRKNLVRLAEATERLGIELRVAGARGWGRVKLPRRVRPLGFVSDEHLAALYRGAVCLAYPSLYEGFGIPILEAMACGTPVVTSAGGATEETAAGAAVLVDPLDPASIAAGIEEAQARAPELRALGLERARLFTWDAAARATADVYREAAA